MNVDGSGLRRSDLVIGGGPEWSPDGSQITFYSNRDGNSEIYVMNVDSSDQKRLTYSDADNGGPSGHLMAAKLCFNQIGMVLMKYTK